MDFLSSNSQVMLEKSMGFLWTKQAATLDNISNAETPGYKTKVITFEEGLRAQLKKASDTEKPRASVRSVLEGSDWAVDVSQENTRMDDNGVDVTEETLEMVRNAYQIQYVMQSISSQLSTLGTAIRGQ
jgi:flagellar basal-body rod protein FlgB